MTTHFSKSLQEQFQKVYLESIGFVKQGDGTFTYVVDKEKGISDEVLSLYNDLMNTSVTAEEALEKFGFITIQLKA